MGKDYLLGIYFSAKHKPFILHLTLPQEVVSGLVCNALMLFNAWTESMFTKYMQSDILK